MIDSLITILSQNSAESLCEGGQLKCSTVDCKECPFYNQKSLDETIKELKKAQEKQDV